jgi:predicted RNase H-like nuclease (RuvC/YqgF family)
LLLKESDHGDLLDKSMSMDTSVLSHTEIRHLHENIRRLEEEIEEKKSIIYDLQKEKYLYENSKREMEGQITNISRVNTSLEQKIFDLKKEI